MAFILAISVTNAIVFGYNLIPFTLDHYFNVHLNLLEYTFSSETKQHYISPFDVEGEGVYTSGSRALSRAGALVQWLKLPA